MSVRDLPIDSQIRRVAGRLSVLELMADDEQPSDDSVGGFTKRESIWDQRGGRPGGHQADEHFLDFYSDQGLHHAFKAYGVHDALLDKGLSQYHFEITRYDAFHHRLEILLDDDDVMDAGLDVRRVMDLRVHLTTLRPSSFADVDPDRPRLPVMVVEWLAMQNPKEPFTERRPRLPGQRHPGTGLGRIVHSLLLIVAERLRRHAVIHIPEHFHLACLYHRAGYRFAHEGMESELVEVQRAVEHLPFAMAGWAVERGFVFHKNDDGTTTPYIYKPQEMVLPLSREMKGILAQNHGFFRRLLPHVLPSRYEVDAAALRHSLMKDPVEGVSTRMIDKHLPIQR